MIIVTAVLQACSAFKETLSDADLAKVEEVLELFNTEEVCNAENCAPAVQVRANSPVVYCYVQAASLAKPIIAGLACMTALKMHQKVHASFACTLRLQAFLEAQSSQQ